MPLSRALMGSVPAGFLIQFLQFAFQITHLRKRLNYRKCCRRRLLAFQYRRKHIETFFSKGLGQSSTL